MTPTAHLIATGLWLAIQAVHLATLILAAALARAAARGQLC